MTEHDDDLASEVIEGEELEGDTFQPEDEDDLRRSEQPGEGEEAPATEDDSEI